MSSARERFWSHEVYAVVGHQAQREFPKLTYRGLKASGKKVYAVDPSGAPVEGDASFASFDELPEPAQAAVLELPSEETADWVRRAADAGIPRVWLHMRTDTPEAVAAAEDRGLELQRGSCAVMYVTPGPTLHSIHKWIMKATKKY